MFMPEMNRRVARPVRANSARLVSAAPSMWNSSAVCDDALLPASVSTTQPPGTAWE